jgi:predicted anti-sigma-YlaC factor YlaD
MKTKLSIRKSVELSVVAVLLCSVQSCSVKKMALNSVIESLSSSGSSTVFTGERDPQLVADAFPVILKLYESLQEQAPDNPDIHYATGKAFTMYAHAFVVSPAQMLPEEKLEEKGEMMKRGKGLLLRGRGYLFRALDCKHPQFSSLMKNKNTDSALALTSPSDTAFLYWLGASWMAAITVDKMDLGLVVSMPQAIACLKKVMEYNDSYSSGAVNELFIQYYGGLPESMGGSEEKARHHFKKAIEYSNGAKAGPYLALATSVSVRNQDIDEFERLCTAALEIDVDEYPQHRLTNILAQQKAEWLLEHIDTKFVMEEESENEE